ncbi:MAG TPA: hypothetical protein VGL09_08375 [Methylomirabilota bacterium]
MLSVVWGLSVVHACYDAIHPPPPDSSRRTAEGLILVGVFLAMAVWVMVLPANRHDARAREAARIQDALWEATWIVEQAQQHRASEGRAPASVEELRRRVPAAKIEATDPWGGDWVISATDDAWACSRGPRGTGQCPPGDPGDAGRSASGSIGYSARGGGWSSPPTVSTAAVDALALVLFVGSPIAYVACRVIRRRRGRPAPALTGGLAVLGFLLIVSVPQIVGMALHSSIEARARQAKAQADVCVIATAISAYRAQTGTLPAALADVTLAVTNSQGVTCGPFLERMPTPLGRGSYIYKRGLGGTFIIRYREPEFSAFAECRAT